MRPHMFLLTGFPGTGKLTVARALATSLEEDGSIVRVVDNHWINNPIFGLVATDGVTPLPAGVWNRVGDVARAVFRTAEEITPRDWHLVFTAYLDGMNDTGWVPRLAEIAESRESVLVPVRLLCDADENARRIVSPERARSLKSIDPNEPHRLAADGPPYEPPHQHTMTLDVTTLTPDDAATRILQHAAGLG